MTDDSEPEAAMTPHQLSELRIAMRYTQAQMAEAMGLSRRAYIDIENGGTMRKIHQLAAERVALTHLAEHRTIQPLYHTPKLSKDLTEAAIVIDAISLSKN